MADCGSRQSYADGCRCFECKSAQAAYRRERQASNAGVDVPARRVGRPPKDSAASVTVLPGSLSSGCPGAVEQATLDELAGLTSAETHKAIAAGALVMARILDNPLALAQQSQALARLEAVMERLRKGSQKRKGRLASVQAMTRATGTDGGV